MGAEGPALRRLCNALGASWLPALLLLAVPLLPGCVGCQPLLDVRHCLDGPCVASPDAVHVEWTTELGQQWPDVDALMRRTDEGEHEHRSWTPERREALWQAFGVNGTEPELIILFDEEWYRVRVLRCD